MKTATSHRRPAIRGAFLTACVIGLLCVPLLLAAAPAAPSKLDARANPLAPTTAVLTWKDNSLAESGFRIDRRLKGTSAWSRIVVLPPNSTSFIDTGVTPGVGYEYRVSAYTVVEEVSGFSNTDSAFPVLPPATTQSTTPTTLPTTVPAEVPTTLPATQPTTFPATQPAGGYDKPLPPVDRLVRNGETINEVPAGRHFRLAPGAVVRTSGLSVRAYATLSSDPTNRATLLGTSASRYASTVKMSEPGGRVYGVRIDNQHGSKFDGKSFGVNAADCRIEYCDHTERMDAFILNEGRSTRNLLVYRNRCSAVLGGDDPGTNGYYFLWSSAGNGPFTVIENVARVSNMFTLRIHGAAGESLIEGNEFYCVRRGGEQRKRNVTLRGTQPGGKIVFRNNTVEGGAFELGYDTSEETYHRIEVIGNRFRDTFFNQIVGTGGDGTFLLADNVFEGRDGGSSGRCIDTIRAYKGGKKDAGNPPRGAIRNNRIIGPWTELIDDAYPTLTLSGNTIAGGR